MANPTTSRAQLQAACDQQQWALLDLLLERDSTHINDHAVYSDTWGDWWGFLLECVYQGHVDGVRVLLKHGADRKVGRWGDCIPESPLQAAERYPEILALLRDERRPTYVRPGDPLIPLDDRVRDGAQPLPTILAYDFDDVLCLIRPLPYVQLMREQSGLLLLRQQVSKIEAWCEFLPQYRTVLCEPLDFAYRYLRCLGALDELLLQDLLLSGQFTWRGIVMGAWLGALEPRAEFRELLLRARPLAPKNRWVIDLAVAAIDEKRPPQAAEHLDALEKIRRALAPIPRPAIRLRRYDGTQSVVSAEEARLIGEIYRTRGTDVALRHLATHSFASKTGMPCDRDPIRSTWAYGMHPPFSMQDLMAWKPPPAIQPGHTNSK
jgi:hypothetical protein